MKTYDHMHALPPKGIERKRAHVVGGGRRRRSVAIMSQLSMDGQLAGAAKSSSHG